MYVTSDSNHYWLLIISSASTSLIQCTHVRYNKTKSQLVCLFVCLSVKVYVSTSVCMVLIKKENRYIITRLNIPTMLNPNFVVVVCHL